MINNVLVHQNHNKSIVNDENNNNQDGRSSLSDIGFPYAIKYPLPMMVAENTSAISSSNHNSTNFIDPSTSNEQMRLRDDNQSSLEIGLNDNRFQNPNANITQDVAEILANVMPFYFPSQLSNQNQQSLSPYSPKGTQNQLYPSQFNLVSYFFIHL